MSEPRPFDTIRYVLEFDRVALIHYRCTGSGILFPQTVVVGVW